MSEAFRVITECTHLLFQGTTEAGNPNYALFFTNVVHPHMRPYIRLRDMDTVSC